MSSIDGFQSYATTQIFYSENPELIKHISVDGLFYLDYRYDPSYMNWVKENNGSLVMMQEIPDQNKIDLLKYNNTRAYELIIVAKNDGIAENINNLIYSGRLLAYPSIYDCQYSTFISEVSNNIVLKEFYRKKYICETMLLSCVIAKRSIERKLVYGVEKYRFSLNLDSISPHSGNPIYGEVFYTGERSYSSHVNSGTAIFTACSIIEELGLEIRSSSKNPRFINNNTEWNPKVRENLKKRLSDFNILENETINWITRGKLNPIYDAIKPKLDNKNSKWYNGIDIFDKELNIIDAIHYTSYIRNFFIAHRYNEVVKYFTPYDVHNIQNLARRLILAKLDLWKISEKDLEKNISHYR